MEVKKLKNRMKSLFTVHIKQGISGLHDHQDHLVSNESWGNLEGTLGGKGVRHRKLTVLMDEIGRVQVLRFS
jgi:hypothetical protein